jgi:hypothetical protein
MMVAQHNLQAFVRMGKVGISTQKISKSTQGSERRVLLAGCWWLVCSERKVLLAGG